MKIVSKQISHKLIFFQCMIQESRTRFHLMTSLFLLFDQTATIPGKQKCLKSLAGSSLEGQNKLIYVYRMCISLGLYLFWKYCFYCTFKVLKCTILGLTRYGVPSESVPPQRQLFYLFFWECIHYFLFNVFIILLKCWNINIKSSEGSLCSFVCNPIQSLKNIYQRTCSFNVIDKLYPECEVFMFGRSTLDVLMVLQQGGRHKRLKNILFALKCSKKQSSSVLCWSWEMKAPFMICWLWALYTKITEIYIALLLVLIASIALICKSLWIKASAKWLNVNIYIYEGFICKYR